MNVAISYKNFAIHVGISHIGLGVAALNNAKVLEQHKISCSVLPTNTPADLEAKILESAKAGNPFTHVVVSAPWIPIAAMQRLCQLFPSIQFFVNCHSNVGFLQADPSGVALLREYVDLELGQTNFHIAGNSKKFVLWLREAYRAPCAYMPNMYFLDYSHRHDFKPWRGGALKIGAFGAVRPQKNIMTAAGAALIMCNDLKADVEFWISGGRTEGGGEVLVRAIKQMLVGIPGITLKEMTWNSWPQFRDAVRRMDLLFQVSYTESFNMVTADGIAEGVPSVVSEAIDWAPKKWKAHFDNSIDIAQVGGQLLKDKNALKEGYNALNQHNQDSFKA